MFWLLVVLGCSTVALVLFLVAARAGTRSEEDDG